MNKELFQSMQNQMKPSPEVRAALSEKLAQPMKKRSVPWAKYGAVAACAALVVGVFSVYSLRQNPAMWMLLTRNFHHDAQVQNLHSYVTVEGMTGCFTESVSVEDVGGSVATGASSIETSPDLEPNTGILPGGAYIGDAPTQEEAAAAYDKLAPYIRSHPDWYGGAYIDNSGTLVVCLVESENPGDKSLELKILDWTDNGRVAFTSGKYSLGYLLGLQTKVCGALYEMGLDFGCGTDEEYNRLDLTLSSVTEEALALLARLDPDDDAIYVQVGQFVAGDYFQTEDDANLIADEPWVDEVERLPEELPESKLPAVVQSVPEEDT